MFNNTPRRDNSTLAIPVHPDWFASTDAHKANIQAAESAYRIYLAKDHVMSTRRIDSAVLSDLTAGILEGGATVPLYRGDLVPATGYVVGVGGITVPADRWSMADHVVVDFIQRADSKYIGVWMEDGVVYVDKVSIVPDRDRALELADVHGEIAIYDLNSGETIYRVPTARTI